MKQYKKIYKEEELKESRININDFMLIYKALKDNNELITGKSKFVNTKTIDLINKHIEEIKYLLFPNSKK
jgi:hypothetical protein